MINRISKFIILLLASGFFMSYPLVRWQHKHPKRTGAGLAGSGWGFLALWFLPEDKVLVLIIVLITLIASIIVAHSAEKILASKDDPRIVIDEFAGMLIAGILLPKQWLYLLPAFILFRVFDVLKWPFGKTAERLPGGVGVVMDDVLAGILANLCVHMSRWILI